MSYRLLGINEFGVGIGNEHFHSHALPTDDPGNAPQAEFTDLTRLVLERTSTALQAVRSTVIQPPTAGQLGALTKHANGIYACDAHLDFAECRGHTMSGVHRRYSS